MRPRKRLVILLFLLISGCNKEIIFTEEQLPEEILFNEDSNTPFSGKCLIYYKHSQKVHFIFNYENGIVNGAFKSFYKNGEVEYQGTYKEGELEGVIIKRDEKGTTTMQYTLSK